MPNYIDNAEFFGAMKGFNAQWKEAQKRGIDNPRVSEYIGKCLLDIAKNLSLRREFIGYSFREDMVMDGVENCLTYIHNFDPAKTKNPFAYFTQIIYYAFMRRIGKEQKQSYIKAKMHERYVIFMDELNSVADTEDKVDSRNNYEIISKFEEAKAKKKKKRAEALPKIKAKALPVEVKPPKKRLTKKK